MRSEDLWSGVQVLDESQKLEKSPQVSQIVSVDQCLVLRYHRPQWLRCFPVPAHLIQIIGSAHQLIVKVLRNSADDPPIRARSVKTPKTPQRCDGIRDPTWAFTVTHHFYN